MLLFFFNFFFSFLEMDLIFGNNKELLKEYRFLVNEILPSLNDCRFCNKLKCKFYKQFCVNYNICKKEKCLNCHRFNKSKDILINRDNDFISGYVQNFLHDYFKVSNITNFFLNMNVNQIVKDKDPMGVVNFNNKRLILHIQKKKKRIFYFKTKKYRHYFCKLI